jgi:hypothetical protein
MNQFLYIDPGTGSMLFSVMIGLLTTLYFVGKAALLKLKFLFTGKSARPAVRGTRTPVVVYSEGKQYWNVFAPILDEFERRSSPVLYFTSAEDDPAFGKKYEHVVPEFIGKGNKAFARLNFLEADVCLMTTPGLDVYQLKRSKGVKHYSHILHAVDDATSYRLFGLDYFDSVLLSGDYQKADVVKLEEMRGIAKKELVTVGCPYLDVMQAKVASLPKESDHPFTVLVAPSWGPSGILLKYGSKLLDRLAETGWRIIVRPHPQSSVSEKDALDALTARYAGNTAIVWDYSRENLECLSRADIMISDFSGVIFDYVFLFDRPFLYLNQSFDLKPYDAWDLGTTPWKFRVLPEIGKELRESEFDSVKTVIESAVASSTLAKNREKAKATAWQHPGESGTRAVDYILSKTHI